MAKKILVVDDDTDIIEPISLLLEEEGYRVDSISQGEKTYEKVEQFKPDLILLDVLISGTDGRTICRVLKKDKKTQNIPVIMMSAHPNAHNDAKEFGANGFIAKPFETEDLIQAIKEYI